MNCVVREWYFAGYVAIVAIDLGLASSFCVHCWGDTAPIDMGQTQL
jgi:hypothetical protein